MFIVQPTFFHNQLFPLSLNNNFSLFIDLAAWNYIFLVYLLSNGTRLYPLRDTIMSVSDLRQSKNTVICLLIEKWPYIIEDFLQDC